MNKIRNYLEEYEDLWHELSNHDLELPIMDIALNNINEKDYYGCDFTNKNQVMMLFFTGSSDFFPGFYIGVNKYKENLDEFPIYVFDLSSSDGIELIGNFKKYMQLLLQDYLSVQKDSRASNALINLNIFSDKLIEKEIFVLQIND